MNYCCTIASFQGLGRELLVVEEGVGGLRFRSVAG
jgi:hypothetical protein